MRVAFIGTGGISGAHLSYLNTRNDVDIVALCDLSAENLEKRIAEYGGTGYSDFEQMLDSEKPDAVWLCTPPLARRDPLLACADRGIPVFCEKPVAVTQEDAHAIQAELEKRQAKVQVGYVFRSLPVIDELKSAIADDRIHLIQSLYFCNISLTRTLRSWFYDKSKSGGALMDQATHNLDLLRYLLGEVVDATGHWSNPVQDKGGDYTIEEVITLSMKFADGALGTHIHSWVADGWRNEIQLSGEKRFYRLNPSGTLVIEEGGESRTYEQPEGSIFQYENDRFIDAVRNDDWQNVPSDYADGVRTLDLIIRCDEAICQA